MRRPWICLSLTVFLLALAASAYAAEQRCTALGANCLCSEQLNTSDLSSWNGTYYNPGDSSTLQCTSDTPDAGYGFYDPGHNTRAAGAGSAPISALPAGHSVSYVWRAPDGSVGGFGPESVISPANLRQNMAFRWYMYLSPDFNFTGESGGCHRAKWFFIGNQAQSITFYMTSEYGLQNWLGSTINFDCCNQGPFRTPTPPPDRTTLKGRWTRFELVIQNTNTNGFVAELFIKRLGIDSGETSAIYSGPGSTDPYGYWAGKSGVPSPSQFPSMRLSRDASGWEFRKLAATAYGEALGGTCTGYAAFSHFMAAGWDGSYAGQRIGPAAEVESGQTTSPAPAPPGNLITK